MASRLDLQTLLEGLTENVYFQPPTSIEMQFPCIIYNRDPPQVQHADNLPYTGMKGYQVTVVDRDPDSELPDQVEALSYCSFERHFRAENLNHYVFNLFF